MTYLEGECLSRRAKEEEDSQRTETGAYLTFKLNVLTNARSGIVVSTSVECLFSITPLPRRSCATMTATTSGLKTKYSMARLFPSRSAAARLGLVKWMLIVQEGR